MKTKICLVLTLATACAFTGCRKKTATAGGNADSAVQSAQTASSKAAQGVDKETIDLQKKLDEALKK